MGETSEREKQTEERTPSRPLHNFTLPTRLKWGKQRKLLCMNPHSSSSVANRRGGRSKSSVRRRSPVGSFLTNQEKDGVNSFGLGGSSSSGPIKNLSPIEGVSGGGGGGSVGGRGEIEAVSHMLMTNIRVEADLMNKNILEENEKKPDFGEEINASRPWNLRRRRGGGSNVAAGGGGGNVGFSPLLGGESRPRNTEEEERRGGGEGSSRFQRPKFSRTLTKEEIEADFLAMTGAKPPRRPKRRPKVVQKQIDRLFPGSWLSEVTPDTYKVPDNGDQGK